MLGELIFSQKFLIARHLDSVPAIKIEEATNAE